MTGAIDPREARPLALVGRGSQGEVWLATAGTRLVALKLLRTRDEAAAAALLSTAEQWLGDGEAGVLPLLAVARLSEAPEALRRLAGPPGVVLALPFVNGPTARELGERLGSFPPVAVATALAQLAQPLSRLHADGRRHLDVKPENVLVGADGRLHLFDPSLGETRGSPGYAAPEQGAPAGSALVGSSADAHALGRLGFALWSGVFPSPERLRLPELPVPPPNAPPELRRALERLADLLRALVAARPEERPPLAEAAREAEEIAVALGADGLQGPIRQLLAQAGSFSRLEALAAELARQGVAAPGLPRAARSGRRLLWPALGLGVGLLAVGGLASLRLRRPAPPAAASSPDAGPRFLPLALGERPPEGWGGFQITVVNPESRVAVLSYMADVIWEHRDPKLGESYKIALRPDEYLYDQDSSLPGAKFQTFPLTVVAGDTVPYKTPPYRQRAPLRTGAKQNPKDPNDPWSPLTPEEKERIAR